MLKADVDAKRLPSAVLLVARQGKVAFYDSAGFRDRASQTVAVIILSEENKLDVAASVAQYLPEFRDVKVGPEAVAPKRPMFRI